MRGRTLSAALVLCAAFVPATAAYAAPAPSATVVLELATPVATLSAAEVRTTAARSRTAQALTPTAATRQQAAADAEAAGLTVTKTTTWSLTATGPAATIQQLEAENPWPSTVAEIVDPTEGHFTSHAAQAVSDLAQAYGGATPSAQTPTLTSSTPIIATIQLSGWDPTVLTQDAKKVYFDASYDPVASGQYTAVSAGRTQTHTVADGAGEDEVALDQETLLGVAPELKQRAYFAVNTATGYAVGLQDIYNDVVAGLPIVALSTSWGACETSDTAAARNTIDAALAKLTAVGVTVFAASGDDGAYDCTDKSGDMTLGVDFPASDPHVVGVGATTHDNGAGTPLPDTAWSDGNDSTPGGSGGGTSSVYAKPSYQSAVTATGRAVPDIAMDGDPNTGITIVTSDTLLATNTISGGTSLAAPLAAGLLADSAAARTLATGITSGYGDIHAILYSHPDAFTDVVATTTEYGEGNTGFTYPASAGYDEVSGLGTPKFDVLGALLGGSTGTGSTALSATGTAPRVAISSWSRPNSASNSATLKWKTSGGTVGVGSFIITVTAAGKKVYSHTVSGATRSVSLKLPPGDAVATVTLASSAGSSKATAGLMVPTDDRAATKGRGWTAVRDPGAYLGTLSTTSTVGRRAVFTGTGSAFRVTFRYSNAGGRVKLLLDGRQVATVSTYAARTRENVTTLVKAKKGKHALVIVVVSGSVALDALSAA